jgi:hypothetical protein
MIASLRLGPQQLLFQGFFPYLSPALATSSGYPCASTILGAILVQKSHKRFDATHFGKT